jgi:hypothetical protein
MPRVSLNAPMRFNPTGYGRETVDLPAGEQEASPAPVAFVRANPAIGEVLPNAEVPTKPASPAAPPANRDEWPQLTPMAAKALQEAGFDTPAKLREATDEALLAVKGVGQKVVEIIRAYFAAAAAGE